VSPSGPQREPRAPRLAGPPLETLTWSEPSRAGEAVLTGDGIAASGLDLQAVSRRAVTLRRFALSDVRLDHSTRTRWERCRLVEADFQGARVAASVVVDCDLSHARLYQAEFATSVVRDCRFDGLGGLEALRGAELSWPDVIDLAPTLAARFGIRIHRPE